MTETQQRITLPYFPDSAQLFDPLADQDWAVFLDSGYPHSKQGRYDFIACDPVVTLVTEGEQTTVDELGQSKQSNEDPFLLLKKYLQRGLQSSDDLPFDGGAIGYFSYDLARRLEKLPVIAKDAEHIADMAVGIYAWVLVVDHDKKHSCLIGNNIEAERWQQLIEQFSALPKTLVPRPFSVLEKARSNMDKSQYEKAFSRIKYYLTEGDSYQVNLAQRFCSPCHGNAWTAYLSLRKINSAPFSAFINLPALQVLSSSPERFLKVRRKEVETKPIKGTRPRLSNSNHDQQQIQALSSSDKDRAENVMIVDLLRNDISKNCQEGSVKVPKLFDVESFATVHHLVSTVKGVLAEGQHALDLLRNCFPGGSITGAPKIRSMEIIEELEPHRRGVYCGSIAYIGFNGNMDSNIAIRTLVHSDHKIRFWAGGGIVNDSVMEAEYQESFDKAAALLNLLQQFEQ